MMPATWPDARTPASVLPSTSPARSSIGVFADIMSWLHVRSPPFFMASPSLTRPFHETPVRAWKRTVFTAACASVDTPCERSRASTRAVRRTRCGIPSTLVVTTVSPSPRCRYSAFTDSGTRLSRVSRKRVPMATPAAP